MEWLGPSPVWRPQTNKKAPNDGGWDRLLLEPQFTNLGLMVSR